MLSIYWINKTSVIDAVNFTPIGDFQCLFVLDFCHAVLNVLVLVLNMYVYIFNTNCKDTYLVTRYIKC